MEFMCAVCTASNDLASFPGVEEGEEKERLVHIANEEGEEKKRLVHTANSVYKALFLLPLLCAWERG